MSQNLISCKFRDNSTEKCSLLTAKTTRLESQLVFSLGQRVLVCQFHQLTSVKLNKGETRTVLSSCFCIPFVIIQIAFYISTLHTHFCTTRRLCLPTELSCCTPPAVLAACLCERASTCSCVCQIYRVKGPWTANLLCLPVHQMEIVQPHHTLHNRLFNPNIISAHLPVNNFF